MIALGVSVTGECVQRCVVFVSWSLSVRLREGGTLTKHEQQSAKVSVSAVQPGTHVQTSVGAGTMCEFSDLSGCLGYG